MTTHNPGSSSSSISQYPGMLKKLTVENFLRLSFLPITFNEKVTRVIGKKGFGNNFIQKVISAAFGFEPLTPRMIETGSPDCSIKLVFNNQGGEPFQGEDYGSEIILERRISSSGLSSVQLKNCKGTAISVEEKDVKTLLSFFELNQVLDVHAIGRMDKKEKYNLFLKSSAGEIGEVPRSPKRIVLITIDDDDDDDQGSGPEEVDSDIEELRKKKKMLENKRSNLESIRKSLTENQLLASENLTWAKINHRTSAISEYEKEFGAIQRDLAEGDNELLATIELERETERAILLLQSRRRVEDTVVQQVISNVPDQKSKDLENFFQRVLRIKSITGQMIVDHAGKQIEITADPPFACPETETFFNQAFVLALWNISDQRFLSIDIDYPMEFSEMEKFTALLCEMANGKPNSQIVFFTPEGQPQVISEGFSTVRLGDPNITRGSVIQFFQEKNSDLDQAERTIDSRAISPLPPPSVRSVESDDELLRFDKVFALYNAQMSESFNDADKASDTGEFPQKHLEGDERSSFSKIQHRNLSEGNELERVVASNQSKRNKEKSSAPKEREAASSKDWLPKKQNKESNFNGADSNSSSQQSKLHKSSAKEREMKDSQHSFESKSSSCISKKGQRSNSSKCSSKNGRDPKRVKDTEHERNQSSSDSSKCSSKNGRDPKRVKDTEHERSQSSSDLNLHLSKQNKLLKETEKKHYSPENISADETLRKTDNCCKKSSTKREDQKDLENCKEPPKKLSRVEASNLIPFLEEPLLDTNTSFSSFSKISGSSPGKSSVSSSSFTVPRSASLNRDSVVYSECSSSQTVSTGNENETAAKKPRKRRTWTEKDMQEALKAVTEEKCHIGLTALLYDIPSTTLRFRLKKAKHVGKNEDSREV